MKRLTLEDVRISLSKFANEIYEVPDYFETHSDYLDGISNKEFIKAFITLRNIIKKYYIDASSDMIGYGYSGISRKSGNESLYKNYESGLNNKEKEAQALMLLQRICKTSKLEEDNLVVNIDNFKKAINSNGKLHKPDLIIRNLMKYGFNFKGYKKSIKKSERLSLLFPDNPHLIKVLKNYCDSKYAGDGGMNEGGIYDFAHFNYKLLTIPKNESLQLNNTLVFCQLNNKAKLFLDLFNQSMNMNGFSFGDRALSGLCWGDSQFAYSPRPESKKDYVARLYQKGDSLIVRLFLKHIDRYTEFIEKSPDYIKTSFVDSHGKCTGCKSSCKTRKTYTIYGKEYSKCQGEVFYFRALQPAAVEQYMDLLILSKSKGNATAKHVKL